MSEETTKKFDEITEAQIKAKGVQALANRPNASSQYGQGGLSAEGLKNWFDQLVTYVAKRVNDITDAFNNADEAGKYIHLALTDIGIDSLYELVESFKDGTFASSVMKVFPNSSAEEVEALQSVINTISRELSKKVDEVEGKGLSENDLTDELKGQYDSAYTHSTSNHARADATKVEHSIINGNIKINGVEKTVYIHPEKHSISDVDGLQTALNGKIPLSQKGAMNGVASLGADNKVPNTQLPDFVSHDDLNDAISALIGGAPEALDTLKEITDALADNDDVVSGIITSVRNRYTKDEVNGIVESLSEIYTKVEASDTNGNIKINGVEKTVYEHPQHQASDIQGLLENGKISPDLLPESVGDDTPPLVLPFTSADAGKFVVVSADGGLEAVTISVGGEY